MGSSKNDLLGCQVTGQLGPNPVLTPVGGADPVGLLMVCVCVGGGLHQWELQLLTVPRDPEAGQGPSLRSPEPRAPTLSLLGA